MNTQDKTLACSVITASLLWACSAIAQGFRFDSSISRPVLENYLSRSISFTELLHDDLTKPRNNRGIDPRDNMRLILGAKAKFIGRALMVWGREKNLSAFLETAKPYAAALHKADPEITWFSLQPEKERNDWLRYAWKWVKETDANGHLQMPGSRLITPGTSDGARWHWANTRSDACPNGSNTEETIRDIWAADSPKR